MAQRYANSFLLFLMVIFYTPIIPMAPLIGFGGTLFANWIEKYNLLRRHKMPEMMGPTLGQFFANLIPYTMILYSVANFVFVDEMTENGHPGAFAMIIVTCIYILLPIRIIVKQCFDDVYRNE
jgi:hypothetical protein